MAAARALLWIGVTSVIGSAVGMITIDPLSPVVRSGETVRLMCRADGPIRSCLWQINNDLYTLGEGQRFQPYGQLSDGECGIQAVMSEAENGEWTCRVFSNSADKAEKATTNVTLLALPQISLRPNADPITVMAGQESEVTCVVADARPVPAILWMIGDAEIDSPRRVTTDTTNPKTGTKTITDKLKHTFEAVDHGKKIHCMTAGSWLNLDDPREASAHLNVIFSPQPKDTTTLYGYVAGQAGDVVVDFTANPRPVRVYWKVDDDKQLNVFPFDGSAAGHDRFDVAELKQTDQISFEARLRVRSVSESDARRPFHLLVESDLSGELHLTEYFVWISMNAAPMQCNSSSADCSSPSDVSTVDRSDSDLAGGVSGGGIAGIIIAVLATLVILVVLLFARNTGQWCFAGTKAVGVSTKDSADEEAGAVGEETELTASAAASAAANASPASAKSDAGARPSLTNRLSSLYESLLSKAAPKKLSGDRVSGGVGNNGADIDVKEAAIVYAELELKAPEEGAANGAGAASPTSPAKEETEYAEIVAVTTTQDKSPAQSPVKETADNKTE